MNGKWLIIGILLAGLMVGTVSAANIEVFNQNYTALGATPPNVVMLNNIIPYTTNSNITYNASSGSIDTTWDYTIYNTGDVWVGGLTPAVNTTYNILMDTDSFSSSSYVQIIISGITVNVMRRSDDSYRIYQFYHRADGTAVTLEYMSVPAANVTHPFVLSIGYDGYNQTYTTSIGGYTNSSPLMGGSGMPYTQISGTAIRFTKYQHSTETGLNFKLYSINQTVTKTGNITAIGDKSLVSFGLDKPHPANTWEDGAALITTNGGKGTIWADVTSLGADPADTVKPLLADGWELGIHFSTSLTSSNLTTANATIDSETATVAAAYGQAPTSWCSLQNGDNATHAAYAYTSKGMIWRNGRTGGGEFSNIANLQNSTYPFWADASAAGITTRTFTHEIDVDPAIAYSIDPAKFNDWVDNYTTNNMTISPFINWYKTGENTNSATFTESIDHSAILKFTAHTNGYPAFVEIDHPYNATHYITNSTVNATVPFEESPDGNMQFYVSDGITYIVFEDSGVAAITPVASFTKSRSIVRIPQTVTFTDTSTNTPTSWSWDFGDGSAVVTTEDATYSYYRTGYFIINHSATNAAGTTYSTSTVWVQSPYYGLNVVDNAQYYLWNWINDIFNLITAFIHSIGG
jgi:hypothetical protein